MNKYLVMPEGCKWYETEANTSEMAWSKNCNWYSYEKRIAVLNLDTRECRVYTRVLDKNGNQVTYNEE